MITPRFRTALTVLAALGLIGAGSARAAGNDLAPAPMAAPGYQPMSVGPQPRLVFTLRGGVGAKPEYFGSDSYGAVPDLGFEFGYARLFGREFGSADPYYEAEGLRVRGSFRYIGPRDDADSPELAGLNDIDEAVELGMGLSYRQRNFEVFGDVRYGVIGHEAWVGELGADVRLHPTDRLEVTFGPRLFLGDGAYSDTYFGVTPAESAASGLAAYDPEGGALSAGLELGAKYRIDENWGVEGAITYDRLINDAADSPIVQQGSADQWKARIGVTRRFTLSF